jgi:hypothetical protein
MLAAVEAHEALVAGVLGLAALYAHHRRGDPVDRLLALVALWICVTGIAGLPLAEHGDPWRYIRLALRLTGPPLLLVACEESVRTSSHPGSRRLSWGFAIVLWIGSVAGLIWARGGSMFEARFDWFMPLQLGVTPWMLVLALTFSMALLTLVPAAFRRLDPGYGGVTAMLLLTSEAWAAIDPRWGSGALDLGFSLSYRTVLTLALAGIAVLKAFKGFGWMQSAAAASAAPPRRSAITKRPVSGGEPDARKDAADAGPTESEETASEAEEQPATSSASSRKRGGKKKRR